MGTLIAGIKEIFSPAKTTGTNVMLSGNDGTPDGHMTMANLASVLGAFYPLTTIGTIAADSSTTINKGYGLLILVSSAIGRTAMYIFNSGAANPITDEIPGVTVTKQAEYVIKIEVARNTSGYFIG